MTDPRCPRSLKPRALSTALIAALLLGASPQASSGAPESSDASRSMRDARLASKTATRTHYAPPRAPRTGAVHVTNCNDDGPGSLRDAVNRASASDFVDLTHLTCSTITLTSGAIVATQALSLIGPDRHLLAIDGNYNDRVIAQSGAGTLFVSGLTIRNGEFDGDGGCIVSGGDVILDEVSIYRCAASGSGGALFTTGDLRVADSLVSGNSALAAMPGGGGAFVARSVAILRSTLSGNDAPSGAGGAILTHAGHPANYYRNLYESTLTGNHAHVGGAVFSLANSFYDFEIMASTVSGNSADRVGGIAARSGVYLSASTIVYNAETETAAGGIYLYGVNAALLISSIISGNTSPTGMLDIAGGAGTQLFGDHDLIGYSPFALPYESLSADPMLGPLADNGGPTMTHALLPGSPAIHAGSYGLATYDQRGSGYTRHVAGAFDIGAFTVQSTGVVRNVTNCDDAGAGSLRAAIDASTSGDTIDLTALSCGTITLSSGGVGQNIGGNLTLLGPGRDALTIDGGNAYTPIYGGVRGRVTISGLTIAHGLGVNGGCIASYGTLVLSDVAVRDCTSNYLGGGGVLANRIFMTRTIVADNTATATVRRANGGGVFAQSELEMHDSTVSGNHAAGAYDYSLGGGIVMTQAQRVLIENSTISGNTAGDDAAGITGYGAGIGIVSYAGYSSRHIVIRNSTVSGNHAVSAVGGISSEASLRLDNSTVAFNTAENTGPYGGLAAGVNMIFRDYATGVLDLTSSIIAGNTAGDDVDLSGNSTTVFGSHDLVMVSLLDVPDDTLTADPLLATLADNGGATETHALLPGSPALNAGSNPEGLADDQRSDGFPRVVGSAADIGAYEAAFVDAIFANGFDG